jgi:DNA-binding GntR family transcriptional regulator
VAVAPLTKSDQVYRRLRALVMEGELAPGERLVQRQLAERLGVSSIPVLEALRRLEHDGLVVSHPNCGAAVHDWSAADIEGAYLAREALEGIAARLFVERATALERTELALLAEDVEAAVREGDVSGSREADMRLHLHVVRSTHAETLVRLVENSCLVTLTIRHIVRTAAGGERVALAGQHAALAAVLLGEEPEAAERAMRDHIHVGLEQIIKHTVGHGLESRS